MGIGLVLSNNWNPEINFRFSPSCVYYLLCESIKNFFSGQVTSVLCYLWWEMSAHRATLPLLGTRIIDTYALLLWQCVSMIATHFSCFRSIPPRPPSLADITCQAQQWTTWPCGFCHLFPRAAGKEGSEFKPIKWSVITLRKNDPTSSLHIIL